MPLASILASRELVELIAEKLHTDFQACLSLACVSIAAQLQGRLFGAGRDLLALEAHLADEWVVVAEQRALERDIDCDFDSCFSGSPDSDCFWGWEPCESCGDWVHERDYHWPQCYCCYWEH